MRNASSARVSIALSLCGAVTLCSALSCSSDGPTVGTPNAVAGEAGEAGTPGGGQTASSAGALGAAGSGATSSGGTSADSAGAAGEPGSDAGTAGAATNPLTSLAEEDLATTLAQRFCASVAHCCTKGVADCVATETTEIGGILAEAKAAGHVYDASRAAQCANAISALDQNAKCTSFFMSGTPALSPCYGVLDGAIEPGAACTSPFDCRRGDAATTGGYAGCAVLGGQGERRCRAFIPARSVGDPCFNAAAFSGSDAEVHICAGALACVSGMCAALPKEGEMCGASGCADGVCNNGSCVAYAQQGDSCVTATCEFGLECDANSCAEPPSQPWILDVGTSSTTYACPQ